MVNFSEAFRYLAPLSRRSRTRALSRSRRAMGQATCPSQIVGARRRSALRLRGPADAVRAPRLVASTSPPLSRSSFRRSGREPCKRTSPSSRRPTRRSNGWTRRRGETKRRAAASSLEKRPSLFLRKSNRTCSSAARSGADELPVYTSTPASADAGTPTSRDADRAADDV